jgi:hypothetical protein
MDSLLASSTDLQSYSAVSLRISTPQTQVDYLAIESLSAGTTYGSSDAAEVSFDDLYQGLSLSAQKIIDKINELLKTQLPDGVQSLKTEDVTPEATAERIVSTVTGLFSSYSKQHPELEGKDLLDGFMKEARDGVQQGYDDAFNILKGLGAFEYDGVQAGVEQTKTLIGNKLDAFEQKMLKELGIDTSTTAQVSSQVSNQLLAQGGSGVLNVTA